MEPSKSPLAIANACKSYGTTHALKNVSLNVDSGGVIAVLGQNGAGKTTLIRSAVGLLSLDEGSAHLFGKKSPQRVARERIGIMLQDSDLPELLTARELVELFASYYPDPLSVEATLTLADINDFAGKRYKQLSGGQKRRVQFALAIVGNPDLVFLDEPTTGLDPDARRALWAVVRSFVSDGKTIVLTTHYLEEADTLADRIVVMREGEVVADAPATDIRSLLGGSIIRCHTTSSVERLSALAEVTQVVTSGRVSEIQTSDVVVTLRELLAPEHEVTDLSVSRPNLEDVFAREYS
ncbi:MAG: ABC transporter ATP-binding protein [Gammaproteobacteria bacterium]